MIIGTIVVILLIVVIVAVARHSKKTKMEIEEMQKEKCAGCGIPVRGELFCESCQARNDRHNES
jgi:hypothetical protein